MSGVASPLRAGRKEWVGLAVLAIATLFVAFDFFVLLLALPHLSGDLGASAVEQLWIVDIYGFMVGGFLITMGSLGDRIGHRRLLLFGAAGFGVASILAAYSSSPEMLIAARTLLGIAGATLGPATLSLISNMFQDPKQRGTAIGVWASAFTMGAIVGPFIGGLMLDHFWWGSVFLLAVPVSVLVLVLSPALVPESTPQRTGRIDLISVVLSLAAVLTFIYGIKQAASHGWGATAVIAIVVGGALGVIFARRQRALQHPLLDFGLFGNRSLRTALVGLLCFSVVGGAGLLFMTGYFQAVAGLTPVQASLGLLPGLLVGTVSVSAAPMIARRIRPALLISGGMVLVVAAQVMITQVDGGPALLIAAFAVQALGGGPLLALGVGLVISSAPPEKAGSASSLAQIANELGAALGAATLGSVGVAVYRAEFGGLPSTVPAGSADQARENIAMAQAAADRLPADIGDVLLGHAQSAFTSGLHAVGWISAVLVGLSAILVVTRLRKVPALGQEQHQHAGPEGEVAEEVPVGRPAPAEVPAG